MRFPWGWDVLHGGQTLSCSSMNSGSLEKKLLSFQQGIPKEIQGRFLACRGCWICETEKLNDLILLERNGRLFGRLSLHLRCNGGSSYMWGDGKDCFDFWASQSGGTWAYLLPSNSSNQTECRAQMNHGTPQSGSFTLNRPRTKLWKQGGNHFLVFMNNTGVSYCLSIHFVPVPKASLFCSSLDASSVSSFIFPTPSPLLLLSLQLPSPLQLFPLPPHRVIKIWLWVRYLSLVPKSWCLHPHSAHIDHLYEWTRASYYHDTVGDRFFPWLPAIWVV